MPCLQRFWFWFWFVVLDWEVGSVGAGALNGSRSVLALCDEVGVLPAGAVSAHAGRPVSRGATVLGEESADEPRLPLHRRVVFSLLGKSHGGEEKNSDKVFHSTEI